MGAIYQGNNAILPWSVTGIEWESGYEWEPTLVTITGVSTGAATTVAYVGNETISDKKETKKKMRGLFMGYVVDPATDELVYSSDKPFVAVDESSARLKIVQKAGAALAKEVDDYDIVILTLGKIRSKKEVQQVKVIE